MSVTIGPNVLNDVVYSRNHSHKVLLPFLLNALAVAVVTALIFEWNAINKKFGIRPKFLSTLGVALVLLFIVFLWLHLVFGFRL